MTNESGLKNSLFSSISSIIWAYFLTAVLLSEKERNPPMSSGSTIQPSWFFRDKSEKTKFNWFLYELAVEIHMHIMQTKLKTVIKWKQRFGTKWVAEFSAYYAKRMSISIFEKLNGSDVVTLYDMYIKDYCHTNTKSEDAALEKVLAEAWRSQMKNCADCHKRCLTDMEGYCDYFDRIG
jgi:hypothetical protein